MPNSIEVVCEIAAPPQRVFDAVRDMDLHQQSVKHTGERAIGGVTSGLIGLGEHVTFESRMLLFKIRATFRIMKCDAPHELVDVMVDGMLPKFEHTHLFEPTATGTRMRDVIVFSLPWGIVGRLGGVFARWYLRRLIRIRARFLKAHCEQ